MIFASIFAIILKYLLILPTFGKLWLWSLDPLNVTEMVSYVNHFNSEFFAEATSVLTVTTSVNEPMIRYYFEVLLSEILKPLNDVKLKLENVNRDYRHYYAYFNLLLIDSYKSLRKIDPGPNTSTEDFSEYYLVIFYGNATNYHNELQHIFDYFWKFYMVNVAVLVQLDGQPIQLFTYYPYTPQLCHKPQSYQMNSKQSVLNLTAAELYPDKFRNFHKCQLTAALWNVPPYLTLPRWGNDLKHIRGVEGFILKVLAKELNFSMDFVIPPNNEQRGLVKQDGTLTGAIKMLQDRVADLSLGSFRCTLERSTALSPSMTFYQTMQVFTVLAIRQPWSSYEIISYPFDYYIWITTIGLTVILIMSTHLLQYIHKSALKFIYGFSSSSWINLRIIALTLGQPATVEPQRSFARYFITMWVLLTFLLRSTYQGALYDFLNSHKTLSPPDTAKELSDRRYKLIVNVATSDTLSGVSIINDNLLEMVIMNITDAGGYPILEENPDKNYVTGTPRDFLVNYVNAHQKYGVFHVLSETIFSQQLCVYFTKHSYLVSSFDRILQNLRSFGLIDYWASKFFDDRFLELAPKHLERAPLSLSQLSFTFVISLYLYLLALFVFCVEIIWFRLSINK